jgi:putative ABC transport system permease protein
MSDWTIIGRSLRARMFSTVTTVAMVAVAVALLLVLLGMRDAGRRAFERGTGTMHLLVSRDPSPLVAVLNGVFYAAAPQRPMSWAEYRALLDAPRLAGPPVAAQLEWAIPTQLGDSYRGMPVLATTEAFFTRFAPAEGVAWRFAHGRPFHARLEHALGLEGGTLEWSAKDAAFEVVLGSRAAQRSGLRVGQRIYLTHGVRAPDTGAQIAHDDDDHDEPDAVAGHVHREHAFEIVGILEPTGSAHDRALFIDLPSAWVLHAQDFFERDPDSAADLDDFIARSYLPEITGAYLRVRGRGATGAAGALPQVFEQIRQTPGFTVASPAEQVRRLFDIVGNIDQVLLAMAALVMVSSGAGIMLAMVAGMEQRRRQIAVLRVLGSSRSRILALVLTESAVIGLMGAAAGTLLAWLGTAGVSRVLHARLGLVIEPGIGAEWVLAVIVAAVALAAAAGTAPAIMAYRTSVARNLRPIG